MESLFLRVCIKLQNWAGVIKKSYTD